MKLEKALELVTAPIGATSIISAMITGDSDSIKFPRADSVKDAEQILARAISNQKNCQSDAAYWGYEAQISSLKAMVNILKAAEIINGDDLPDVVPPSGGVVMDMCGEIERFGKEILEGVK